MSAFGGKADIDLDMLRCPLLTQIGHWLLEFAVMHNATASMVGYGSLLGGAPREATRFHHIAWRRIDMAARGACAARRASSPRRFLGRGKRRRARREGAPSGIAGRAPAIGLDPGAQRADRRPLGWGRRS